MTSFSTKLKERQFYGIQLFRKFTKFFQTCKSAQLHTHTYTHREMLTNIHSILYIVIYKSSPSPHTHVYILSYPFLLRVRALDKKKVLNVKKNFIAVLSRQTLRRCLCPCNKYEYNERIEKML